LESLPTAQQLLGLTHATDSSVADDSLVCCGCQVIPPSEVLWTGLAYPELLAEPTAMQCMAVRQSTPPVTSDVSEASVVMPHVAPPSVEERPYVWLVSVTSFDPSATQLAEEEQDTVLRSPSPNPCADHVRPPSSVVTTRAVYTLSIGIVASGGG